MEAVARADAPASIVDIVARSKELAAVAIVDRQREIVKAMRNGQKAELPVSELQKISTASLVPSVDVANAALAEMVARAGRQMSGATPQSGVERRHDAGRSRADHRRFRNRPSACQFTDQAPHRRDAPIGRTRSGDRAARHRSHRRDRRHVAGRRYFQAEHARGRSAFRRTANSRPKGAASGRDRGLYRGVRPIGHRIASLSGHSVHRTANDGAFDVGDGRADQQ